MSEERGERKREGRREEGRGKRGEGGGRREEGDGEKGRDLDSVDGFSVQFNREGDKVRVFFDDVFNGQLIVVIMGGWERELV